uniref:Nucleolar MIF4G domain-containing protein 1 n=1 Tax=Phallusia mammillata TaxID=59560 RepID=A0A6F9DMY8_9ASCI|nr:nucleolar MIF4G domain-containing protein 1 [Phallusia mammillata]
MDYFYKTPERDHEVQTEDKNDSNMSSEIGRKQRRRNLKKVKKLKRLQSNPGSNTNETILQQKASIKTSLRRRKKEDRKRPSGAMQRKRKKAKMKSTQIKQLKEENETDEKQITALEKLMHMNKVKKKKDKLPSSFAQDGLDYILNAVSFEEGDNISDDGSLNESADSSNADDEVLSEDEFQEMDIDAENAVESDEDNIVGNEEELSDEDVLPEFEDDDGSLSSENDATNLDHGEHGEPSDDQDKDEANDQHGTEDKTSKYIPPAQRARNMKGDAEKMRKNRRQLQGLFNRLSEANLHSICTAVQDIFNANSRASITEVLTDLILEQFCTADPRPEKLTFETAMLMRVLGCNVGISVLAHFVETIAIKLKKLLDTAHYGEGKELNNLIQLLCSLYQLKAIQSKLLLDLVSIFTEKFQEKDLELLILIMTQVGFQVRKEDPVALKQIIEKISKASTGTETGEDLTRMKYMLEVLTAIKNNNIRKITGYDADLIANRRKKVTVVTKDDGEDFPNVSFQDLLDADIKGRWWIVGSAWAGAPMLEQNRQEASTDVNANVSSQLIEAARKLRMNTDVRRQIFYAALSSEDYIDAFGNILKLNLKGKQYREISHVLVECCQQQKSYNPFYYHLLRKFCRHDRQFLMSLQCTFWDKFKLLHSMSSRHIKNITALLADLLVSEDLPLACLKAIEFSQIDKMMVEFLRNLFLKILETSGNKDFSAPFVKLAGTKQTVAKQGIQLFLQHFMLKDPGFMKSNKHHEDSLLKLEESLMSGKMN